MTAACTGRARPAWNRGAQCRALCTVCADAAHFCPHRIVVTLCVSGVWTNFADCHPLMCVCGCGCEGSAVAAAALLGASSCRASNPSSALDANTTSKGSLTPLCTAAHTQTDTQTDTQRRTDTTRQTKAATPVGQAHRDDIAWSLRDSPCAFYRCFPPFFCVLALCDAWHGSALHCTACGLTDPLAAAGRSDGGGHGCLSVGPGPDGVAEEKSQRRSRALHCTARPAFVAQAVTATQRYEQQTESDWNSPLNDNKLKKTDLSR